jgi:hypothetical protein
LQYDHGREGLGVAADAYIAVLRYRSAGLGTGLGVQNVGASLRLWMPDTSSAGTYTSTLTLTLISS